MRYLIAAVTVALFATPAHADNMKNCGAAWSAMSTADKVKTTYSAYSKTCLAMSYTLPAAAASAPPAGATGQCKDGSYTMSKTRSGACSSPGGVAKWF